MFLSWRGALREQVLSSREKFQTRPVSELDLSDCERCGPSYRLLPKSFPKPMCSNRTELCMQVRCTKPSSDQCVARRRRARDAAPSS